MPESYIDAISRLADLRDRGALTNEEFAAEKRRLDEVRDESGVATASTESAAPTDHATQSGSTWGAPPGAAPRSVPGPKRGGLILAVGAICVLLIVLAVSRTGSLSDRIAGKRAGSGTTVVTTSATDPAAPALFPAGNGAPASPAAVTASPPTVAPSDTATDDLGPQVATSAGLAIPISSYALATAYFTDRVQANEIYAGHQLIVTGRVQSATTNDRNQPVVRLNGANRYLDVQVVVDSETVSRSIDLPMGSAVTFRCNTIREVAAAPMLSGCSFA